MRCPDCNKFVAYDTEVEPEEQGDPEYDGTTLTVEVRRVLNCADCGAELKEAMIEVEADVEIDHTEECLALMEEDDYPEYSTELEYEPTERTQEKDRHGKPITKARYRRTYYGVHTTGTIQCERCEKTADVDVEDDVQASAFEELV